MLRERGAQRAGVLLSALAMSLFMLAGCTPAGQNSDSSSPTPEATPQATESPGWVDDVPTRALVAGDRQWRTRIRGGPTGTGWALMTTSETWLLARARSDLGRFTVELGQASDGRIIKRTVTETLSGWPVLVELSGRSRVLTVDSARDGFVSLRDALLAPLWEVSKAGLGLAADSELLPLPQVADALVLFERFDTSAEYKSGAIVVLDPADGRLLWRSAAGTASSTPVVGSGLVTAAGWPDLQTSDAPSLLRAWSLDSGAELFSLPIKDPTGFDSSCGGPLNPSRVVACGVDRNLTGTVQVVDTDGSVLAQRASVGRPVLAPQAETVVLSSPDGGAIGLGPDGGQRWQIPGEPTAAPIEFGASSGRYVVGSVGPDNVVWQGVDGKPVARGAFLAPSARQSTGTRYLTFDGRAVTANVGPGSAVGVDFQDRATALFLRQR